MLSGGVSHNNPTTAGLFGLFGRSAPEPGVVSPQDQEPIRPGPAPTDTVEISERSRQLLATEEGNATATNNTTAPDAAQEEGTSAPATEDASENPQELTEEQQDQVKELKDRDREVRAHEQAHLAAAGGYARGGPSYEFQRGPDGRRYAVGGHVDIDTSPIANDPEATIRKAQVIRHAANAPAEPSGQDRSVAAQASRMESKARQELNEQRREESSEPQESTTGAQDDLPNTTSSSAADTPSNVAATAPTSDVTPAADAPSQTAPTSSTTGASPQTAPGRFGRSSESVGQLLQLLA